jgi:hypothetical protein
MHPISSSTANQPRRGRTAKVAGANGTILVGGAGDTGRLGQSDGAVPTGWPVNNGRAASTGEDAAAFECGGAIAV